MHLHLSVISKRIKLQMWDCAQKKAFEKNFNLVTNKSYLKWTKGAKITYRKTCVFFNSRSIHGFACVLMNLRTFFAHEVSRFNILEASNWRDFFHLWLEIYGFILISPSNLGAGLPNFTHVVFNPSSSFPEDLASSFLF